jgi:hypothetical protein
MQQRRGGLIGGLILILLGIVFLVQQLYPDLIGGWVFLVGLGVIFLLAYAFSRQYGFLIPGCIFVGLGVPVALLETNTLAEADNGGIVVLGLGLGFVAIWLVDMLVERGRPGGWWPLIPGGILTLVGAGILAENLSYLAAIGKWWPLLLILLGLWIIVDRLRRPS